MVMIGYLSFYFELERTSDRAVVVLTTILVIATMTSSMQEVSNQLKFFLYQYTNIIYCKLQDLPKTSYYKLIDWWFLFCNTMLVVTLGYHTFLAFLIKKSKEEEPNIEMSITKGSVDLLSHFTKVKCDFWT